MSVELSTNTQEPAESKTLYALFNFDTFQLSSKYLTDEEFERKQRRLPVYKAITSMKRLEYTNLSIHTTVSLITLTERWVQRGKSMKVPCLIQKAPIYLKKFKVADTNYVQVLFKKPKKSAKYDEKAANVIKCRDTAIVIAVLFRTLESKSRPWIVSGVYFHQHGLFIRF